MVEKVKCWACEKNDPKMEADLAVPKASPKNACSLPLLAAPEVMLLAMAFCQCALSSKSPRNIMGTESTTEPVSLFCKQAAPEKDSMDTDSCRAAGSP